MNTRTLSQRLGVHVSAVCLSLAGVLAGYSQSAAPQLAGPPKVVVVPPPGPLAWTVHYSYKETRENGRKDGGAEKAIDPAAGSREAAVRYVIAEPVSARITVMESGQKEEAFQSGNYEFLATARSKDVLLQDLASYPTVEQLFRKHIPGVHWVTPKLFVKVEAAQGQLCAYFRDVGREPANPEQLDAILDGSKQDVREAWFNVETGLPVAFKAGHTLGKFTFEAPPSSGVHVPAVVRAKMDEFAAYQTYLSQRAKPEGSGKGR